jgi:hypothetical protein
MKDSLQIILPEPLATSSVAESVNRAIGFYLSYI